MSGYFEFLDGFGGGSVETTDAAPFASVDGDLQITARVMPSAFGGYAGIINTPGFGLRTGFLANGNLELWWNKGGGGSLTALSTAAVQTIETPTWVKVTLDVDVLGSWQVKFYTAPDAQREPVGSAWTQIGATVTAAGVTSVVPSAGTTEIGNGDGAYIGLIRQVIVRDGIEGRVVFRTGEHDVPPDGTLTYTSLSGTPMSITGSVVQHASLAVEDLLQQMPALDTGAPTGIFDWRFVVEVLLPSDTSSLWGTAVWGESTWSYHQWHDITESVRGVAWGRGNDEPYGRPRVGTGSITLGSLDDEWSPWNPSPPLGSAAYFAPGTIIRAGLRSELDTRAYGWLPLFTMLVDKWPVTYVGANGVDRFVDIQLVETTRDLAQIDDNSIGSLEGGGEDPAARLERLLEQAGWLYGLKIEAQHVLYFPTSYPLQSTDMADNRLAECYLTADSCDASFRADKTGAAVLTGIEYQSNADADASVYQMVDFSCFDPGAGFRSPAFGVDWYERTVSHPLGERLYLPYRVDTLTTVNDDDNVINDARYARVGGTQQIYEQDASISRYGRRSHVRSDLITTSDAIVLQLAQYTTIRRGLNVMRVASVDIDTLDRGEENSLVMFSLDTQIPVRCYTPDGVTLVTDPTRPYITGFVGALEHAVEMGSHGVKQWQTRFSIDTRTVQNLPGAQLPST